ncbi:AAA family ATPase [Chitinophaga terrae (ex Kim and Jung 2007)]|nr:AAA family ATPase [Chitinophaga terrae (ex Kim and Jung 2007)]
MKEVIMFSVIKNRDRNAAWQYTFMQQMSETPQDKRHHAEGNVAVHTQMVLDALESDPAYQVLDEEERMLLWAASWLHDIGKIPTTVVDESGISSPGHARVGAAMARQLMYRGGDVPFAIREQITGLIRYHGLPLWIFEKPDPLKTLVKASMEVNTKLLAILARADVNGRWCDDKEALLYRVDCFEEYCKEQDCWGKPKAFESANAMMHYMSKDDASLHYVPFEQPKTKVIMLCGLPGSGKDFYLRQFKDLPVMSLDQIRREWKIDPTDKSGNGRVIQEGKERARQFLRKQQTFIWNATNITRQMRGQLIELFMLYDAEVELVYIEVPYQRLVEQNRQREQVVPLAVVEKLIDKLEVPVAWEAHKVTFRV